MCVDVEYIIYGSGESRYFDHESYQRKCDGKLVKIIMGKAIQTYAGLNHEFMSCLLDWRLRGTYRRFFLAIWVTIDF